MNSLFDDQNCVLLRENNKLKEQIEIKNRELDKLEHVLLANLAHKEQEIADLSAQIEDMKSSSNPCNQQLRCMGLDPAVNAVFLRIKKDMKAANEKLEQTQNDLQAWKFTPDSQTGKRMMTRMRVLLQENEELGKLNQSGHTAKLESEIAMKRTLVEELKQTNSEYENVIDEMDTETDCFQTSIFMLQQQLGIARTTISALSTEMELVSPGRSSQILTQCNWIDSPYIRKQEASVEPAAVERDLNGGQCTRNHVSDGGGSPPHAKCQRREHRASSSSSDSGPVPSHNSDPSVNDHNRAVPTIHEPKSEPMDDDSQRLVSKRLSTKSSSTFNQKKKLTSS